MKIDQEKLRLAKFALGHMFTFTENGYGYIHIECNGCHEKVAEGVNLSHKPDCPVLLAQQVIEEAERSEW